MDDYFTMLHRGKFCLYERWCGRIVVQLLHPARFTNEAWVCRDVETHELLVIAVERLAHPAVPAPDDGDQIRGRRRAKSSRLPLSSFVA